MTRKTVKGYDEIFIDHEFYDPYGDDGRCWGDLYGCFDEEDEEDDE